MRHLFSLMLLLAATTAHAQISLIKDINPDNDDGLPCGFTTYNNKLYLLAVDKDAGTCLWSYDDVNNMISIVADPAPSSTYSGMSVATIVANGKIYTGTNDGTHGIELMMYDGNTMTLVKDINAGPDNSIPSDMYLFNNKVFFSAFSNTGKYLYILDPANNNVVKKDVKTPLAFTEFNGKLYFGADINNTQERKLVVYDPVSDMITEASNNTDIIDIAAMLVFKGNLYFAGSTLTDGMELYKWDGSTQPQRLTDIGPGSIDGVFKGNKMLAVYKDKIFFTSSQPNTIYYYDPSSNITASAYTPGTVRSHNEFCVYAGKLYFRGSTSGINGTGEELYVYDGNTVTLVADTWPGSIGIAPLYMTVYKDHMYFSAMENFTGRELYKFYDAQVLAVPGVDFTALVNLYPNPVSEVFSMDMTVQQPLTFSVAVYDIAGRKVYSEKPRAYETGRHHISVPAGSLAAGNYTIQLLTTSGKQVYQSTFVKQ